MTSPDREFDAGSPLCYYRARYYDSSIGRFISGDPLGFGGDDGNFFRYVFGDPINSVDFSGSKGKKPKPQTQTTTPDPDAAYAICCKAGEFAICPGPKSGEAPISILQNHTAFVWHEDCQLEHENQHLEDLKNHMVPGVESFCKDKVDGTLFVVLQKIYKNRLECSAYQRQSQCLKAKNQILLKDDIDFTERQCKTHCNGKSK